MNLHRQIPRTLDEEHRASLALLDRVERTLLRGAESERSALARPLIRLIDRDMQQHFGFEEDELFPRLAEAGDDGIAALLAQEHADLRELGTELRPLALALAEHGALDAAQGAAFKRLALELVERMVAHIQKESMALLPLLDELLDDETDRELSFAYSAA